MKFTKILVVLTLAVLFVGVPLFDSISAEEAPYIYRQRPPVLDYESGGVFHLSDVRWGYDENKDEQGRRNPKWRKITIDTNKVTKAYFCVKLFPPEWIAGHGLMLYRFDSNSPLETQFKETSKGLVVSVEAHLREGQTYSITQGMKRIWPTVWQISSMEDYLQSCAISNRKLLIYELELTPNEVRRMLVHSLNVAVQDHSKEMYHTLDESCITAQVDMINAIVPKKKQIRQYIIGKIVNPLASLPRAIGLELRRKKLLRRKLPVMGPKEHRVGDITTKNLTGEKRQKALEDSRKLQLQAIVVERRLTEAVRGGHLASGDLMELLYNEVSEYVPWLYVPGVVPGEKNNGEMVLGENFGASLGSATTPEETNRIINNGFALYRNGVKKRMLLEGPSIFAAQMRKLKSLENHVKTYIKGKKLHKGNL